MKRIAISLALGLSLMSCNAQEDKKNLAEESASTEVNQDQKVPPKGNWKVTKEYDENGNIVKFDSVYSYSYSNINGEEANIEDVDSMIQSFRNYFKGRVPQNWDRLGINPFWEDSLIEEDFFGDDFFHNRWKADFHDMQERMLQMDSIRDEFFNRYYPGLIESRDPVKDSIE